MGGTLTRSQLEYEVRCNLGGRTDLNSRLVTFLNWAQDEIAKQHLFKALRSVATPSTVANTGSIPAPTRLRTITGFRIIDGTASRKVTYVPARTWDTRIPYPEAYSTGIPSLYTIWGNTIYLWRIPDDAYTTSIKCHLWPTPFTATGNITTDFDRMDQILILYATGFAFNSLGEQDKGAGAIATAQGLLSDRIKDDRAIKEDMEITPDFETPIASSNYWADPFCAKMP